MSDVAQQQTEALNMLQEKFADIKEKHSSYEEKFNKLDGLDKQSVENCQKALDAFDAKNQEMVLSMEKERQEREELKEQVGNLEKAVVQKSMESPSDYRQSSEYKAFNLLCKEGKDFEANEHAQEFKTLRTDIGNLGGYLVPTPLANEIIREIEEISDVRSLARVRNTQTKTLNIPVRSSIPTASFEGETEAASTSESNYKQETMTAHRQHVIVPVTRDQLNFAQFNMESEIAQDAITAFAQSEGNLFLNGTGVKQPEGLLDDGSGIIEEETASSGVLTLDDVLKMPSLLKQGYQGVYAFNKRTLYELRIEKSNDEQYRWQIGGESMPTTIGGERYVILQDMEDIFDSGGSPVTGAKVALYGDFFRAYNILDAIQMELVRDDVTKKAQAIVEFSWNRYLDGRVVLPEAMSVVKIKA